MTDIEPLEHIYSVRYGDRQLRFFWRTVSRKARKARIHVHPSGLVEVETPNDSSLADAKQALLKRAKWVTRHLDDIEARQSAILPREYVSGETLFYLGRRHALKVIENDDTQHVKLLRGQIQVTTKHPEPTRVKNMVNHWYRNRALDVFERRLGAVSEELPWVKKLPPWTVRQMKTQWGSCSPGGTVILNPHLVKTPTKCIDYVVLHELCHLREHNHSPKFYALLGKAMPDWKEVKDRLDRLSEFYLND